MVTSHSRFASRHALPGRGRIPIKLPSVIKPRTDLQQRTFKQLSADIPQKIKLGIYFSVNWRDRKKMFVGITNMLAAVILKNKFCESE